MPVPERNAVAQGRSGRNPVADYLTGAELQYDGDAQRQNIINALTDALTLRGDALRARRYRDYQNRDGQWDLPTLLSRHFVPAGPGSTLGDRFYSDVTAKQAQQAIRAILRRLRQASSGSAGESVRR